MEKTLMQSTSDLRLSSYAAEEHSAATAPKSGVQGTALSCAGTSPASRLADTTGVSAIRVRDFLLVPVASSFELVGGARSTDLPGPPPRAAPV